jgi:WXXGXW repeat (2 copies)
MVQRPSSRICSLVAAAFSASLLTACVAAPPRGVVYVRTAPPVAIVEVRGGPPAPDHVWIAGYHTWRDSAYVWVPGHWDRGPHPRAVWVSGRWKHNRDGWYWVEGRWK